jgi:hypothetical protein
MESTAWKAVGEASRKSQRRLAKALVMTQFTTKRSP